MVCGDTKVGCEGIIFQDVGVESVKLRERARVERGRVANTLGGELKTPRFSRQLYLKWSEEKPALREKAVNQPEGRS